jgi:hypothetical protein
MHESCKGCLTYNETNDSCSDLVSFLFDSKYYCPCTSCLIKVMCREGCTKYREFHDFIKTD